MNKTFLSELKTLHLKFDQLYKEAQELFLRNSHHSTTEAKMIMPDLQILRDRCKRIAHPDDPTDVSHD